MQADIVVIGAGAFGLSTALQCALRGRSVVVVERDTAGSQASGRAAGLFKSVQADELRTRLARRSIDLAASFGDWAGVPLPVAGSLPGTRGRGAGVRASRQRGDVRRTGGGRGDRGEVHRSLTRCDARSVFLLLTC